MRSASAPHRPARRRRRGCTRMGAGPRRSARSCRTCASARPHGSARYRLPWSWSSFDYRRLCELLLRAVRCALSRPQRSSGPGSPAPCARRADRGRDRPRHDPCAPRRRRARLAAGARPADGYQPPEAPLSRGLEVHPHTDATGERSRRLGRALARAPRLRLVRARRRRGARRGRLLRPAPTTCASPTVALAERLGVEAERYQGNWFPHRLREATEGGVFFVGDSAGHCFPLSGEGIRTAFYFGIACGRELRAVARAGPLQRAGAAPLSRVQRLPRQGLRVALRTPAADPGAAARVR